MAAATNMHRLALLGIASSVAARGLVPERWAPWGDKANEAESVLRTRMGWLPDAFDTRDVSFGCGATVLDQVHDVGTPDMRVAGSQMRL